MPDQYGKPTLIGSQTGGAMSSWERNERPVCGEPAPPDSLHRVPSAPRRWPPASLPPQRPSRLCKAIVKSLCSMTCLLLRYPGPSQVIFMKIILSKSIFLVSIYEIWLLAKARLPLCPYLRCFLRKNSLRARMLMTKPLSYEVMSICHVRRIVPFRER